MLKMKQIKFIISSLLILFFIAVNIATAQQDAMDKIVLNGQEYYLHKVKKSEGLYRIGVNYGVSQKEILEANPEVAFGLKEGQLIKIPVISGRNSNVEELQATEFIFHTVEKGQTVYFISRKYDVPLEVIYKNNPGSDQQLINGTIIKIPKKYDTASDVAEVKEGKYVMHTVQSKETMYALSKQYGVSISEIIDSNPVLKSGILEEGSSIRIPQSANEVEQVVVDKDQKLEDELYIYHSIKQGETMYSIAQSYRAKLNDVEEANPTASADDLALGYLIRIPKASIKASRQDISEDDNLFILHKVKRKETLFAISREYNVDIEILKTINSDKNLNRLRKGSIIKVPNRYWFKTIYEKDQVTEVEDIPVGNDFAEIKDIDCNSYNYYERKPSLKVAVLLPFNVEASKQVNIIEEELDDEIVEKEREEKIISRRSKVFVEFYQGTLMALDSIKKQGVNVEMFVYDTSPDTNKVKQILANPEMKYADIILGPAFAQNLPIVSEFSKRNNIPLVYPFSTNNSELSKNVHLFQLMPIDTLLFESMAKQIIASSVGKRIVLIRTEDEDSKYESQLSELIRNKVYWESFQNGTVPDFVEYKFKQDDLASLEKMFSKEKANTVIIPSIEEAQVNRIITTVKGAREKTKTNVTLWGMPEWLKYQTINPEDIHQLNGHMFSYYAVDYTNAVSAAVVDKYRTWFKTEPMSISPYFQNARVQSNLSRYSLWGYDVSYYFLSALKDYGKQFEYCLDNHHPHAIQSRFAFDRISNWGGFYNKGLYILHFTPDYKMLVSEVKE